MSAAPSHLLLMPLIVAVMMRLLSPHVAAASTKTATTATTASALHAGRRSPRTIIPSGISTHRGRRDCAALFAGIRLSSFVGSTPPTRRTTHANAAFPWSWKATSRSIVVADNKFLRSSWGMPSSLSSSASSSSALSMAASSSSQSTVQTTSFSIGDHVELIVDGTAGVRGVVNEVRGSGWYSVSLVVPVDASSAVRSDEKKSGRNVIVKRRGGQMKLIDTAAGSRNNNNDNDNNKEEEVVPTLDHDSASITTIPEKGLASDSSSSPAGAAGVALPTIIDLDAELKSHEDNTAVDTTLDQRYIRQVSNHASYDKWVVFTDLHCSTSSLNVTLQVLNTVHEEALQRNAGVIFLGDWWHHRGTVRIDCLNGVLRTLREWTVPLIMIPGNHDQVTLRGLEHGLTPLRNAFFVDGGASDDRSMRRSSSPSPGSSSHAGPLIFTHPTKFRNGFFVPHIRDTTVLQSVIQSNVSTLSSALFVHVDVTGAYMNDLIVSRGGLQPSIFPPFKPIYSGHFHKPHVVTAPLAAPGVSIRYVGSPYQTSLSEAGQDKEMHVLDASRGWSISETIPLRIGRRHHRIGSAAELLDLPLMEVSSGDRIVVSVSQQDPEEEANRMITEEGELSSFEVRVRTLRKLGAVVEIREVKPLPTGPMVVPSSESGDKDKDPDSIVGVVEEMSPQSTFSAFLTSEVDRESMLNTTAESLLEVGSALLDGVDYGSGQAEAKSLSTPSYSEGSTDLQLQSVTVKGFGSFKDLATYPLLDRGLVLLRGTNKDDGSDSNGSGKSTLAMAALWALTGSSDPRPMQDAKVSDVVNVMAKSATVSVHGFINSMPFVVNRTKTSTKGSLTLSLNGEDLTRQSIKDTQMLVDEILGVGPQILARTIFHGQHALNGLLEATDAKLKDELSLVVPLALWQEAASLARSKSRSSSKRAAELEGMVSIREQDMESLSQRCHGAKKSADAFLQLFKMRETQVQDSLKEIESSVQNVSHNEGLLDSCQRRLDDATTEMNELEASLRSLRTERNAEVGELSLILSTKSSEVKSAGKHLQDSQRLVDRVEMELATAQEKMSSLKHMWNIDSTTADAFKSSFVTPTYCPTCKQPIDSHEECHSHEELKKSIENEFAAFSRTISKAEGELTLQKSTHSANEDALATFEDELKDAKSALYNTEMGWDDRVSSVDASLRAAREVQSLRSSELQQAARNVQQAAEIKSVQAAAKAELERLQYDSKSSAAAYDALRNELGQIQENLRGLRIDEKAEHDRSTVMTRLADAFGPRGVQTFVLQNAVHDLSTLSQVYLDELSDGTLKLELALDSGDRIARTASILGPDGSRLKRPLSSLSGGQWRRLSLALSLGFSDLVIRRGKLRPSLLVLDEPLTHLDSSGRAQVGNILRKIVREGVTASGLHVSTIIMILQDLAAEELEESFDRIDDVIKEGANSRVVVDEDGAIEG